MKIDKYKFRLSLNSLKQLPYLTQRSKLITSIGVINLLRSKIKPMEINYGLI